LAEAVNASGPERLDPAVNWLLAFQACNACNFTIGLGAPLILTARYLQAGEDVIGVLSAISPLMVALQLFTTNLMERFGYRRLMLMGWGTRSFMLLLIAPLPFLVGVVDPLILSWAIVLPIFLFNVFRGIASGAWLPWLSALLPEAERGRFLGREQVTMNLSSLVTLLFCGWVLGTEPGPWQFSILFMCAWAAGMLSVWFLRKAPEIFPKESKSGAGRSRAEMFGSARRCWEYQPFRSATLFGAVYMLALASVPGFLVLYVTEDLDWSQGWMMKLQSATTIGVLLTALAWGKLTELYGSRPVLRVALSGQLVLLVAWMASAVGLPVANPAVLTILFLLWGCFSAAQAISQTRLVLGSSPAGDVTMAMPIYQMFIAVSGGISPLLWGYALKWLRDGEASVSGAASVGFLVFFAISLVLGFFAQWMLSQIREPKASRTFRMIKSVVRRRAA
jgi:MFS family permease